ncbi:NAD-dependent epimerase/dehydratase family protein [uncultured Roseobacter sp.]|uniref:NAD-dependent epimerase/dehydratase family protein n=1 Tax=uncultured Roseobacter sp. TaxID=114847 RepID=UPI00262C51AF|nr:NAD-dependent epimerase/dehydratase family protein [uncultured Roseobacter sp.]
MRVLLIGGTGFVGSHVTDRFRAADHDVVVLARSPNRFSPPHDDVTYHSGDMADAGTCDQALSGVSCVIHMAGSTVPGTSDQDPEADIRNNLLSLFPLLKRMRHHHVRKMVYLSSGGAIYQDKGGGPSSEVDPLGPLTSYGVVKLAVENYLQIEARRHGLNTVILRPSNLYGPRQGRVGVQGLIGTLLWRVAHDQPIEIWGDGEIRRDYLHVRDIADLCLRTVEARETGIFNAGSGLSHSVSDIIAKVRRISGRNFDVIRKPARAADIKTNVLCCAAAREVFRWTPAIDLDEGIADTWNWVLGNSRAALI